MPQEVVKVRLSPPPSMPYQALCLQSGHIVFDLAHGFPERFRHGWKGIPENTILAGPPHAALIEPLPIRPFASKVAISSLTWRTDFPSASDMAGKAYQKTPFLPEIGRASCRGRGYNSV